MTYTVLGKKSGSFTDKGTGEKVDYGKLYVAYNDDSVEGQVAECLSVKPERLTEISIGDSLHIDRNQYGKVICVELA